MPLVKVLWSDWMQPIFEMGWNYSHEEERWRRDWSASSDTVSVSYTHIDILAQFVAFDMAGSPMWAQAIMVRWQHTHNPQLSGWHTLHLDIGWDARTHTVSEYTHLSVKPNKVLNPC